MGRYPRLQRPYAAWASAALSSLPAAVGRPPLVTRRGPGLATGPPIPLPSPRDGWNQRRRSDARANLAACVHGAGGARLRRAAGDGAEIGGHPALHLAQRDSERRFLL